MTFQSKYITPSDYKGWSGKDLATVIPADDTPQAFLYRLETRLEAFLDYYGFQQISKKYKDLTDYQKEHYKLALLEQVDYELYNGTKSIDSGNDNDRGTITPRNEIEAISIAPNAIHHLAICGYWCLEMGNYPRGFH